MKKKFSLGIFAVCLLTTSVLAACGGKKDSSKPQESSNVPSSLVPTSNSSELSSQGVTTSSHLPSTSMPSSSSQTTSSSQTSSSQPASSSSSSSSNKPSSSSQPASSSSSSSSNRPSSSSQPASSSSSSSSSQGGTVEPFSYEVTLSSGVKLADNSWQLNIGEEAHVVIDAKGGTNVEKEYKFSCTPMSVARVTSNGTLTAVGVGNAVLTVKENTQGVPQKLIRISVSDATPANGGYNFASLAGQEAISKRTEILGSLEKYAMDNHLTGITLFENGGYVKYSERVNLPTTNYITGYGFGLLSEGTLSENGSINETNPDHRMYLHSAYSEDPKEINSRDNKGSQVSDLEGYITSSFWGTKLNSTKDAYEWYPVLAKDTVTYNGNTTAFTRPIPVYQDQEVAPGQQDPNPLGLYSTWRIYVKTSELKYRYNGTSWGGDHIFDNRPVSIDDYEFAYRFLLTGSNQLDRSPEFAGDETYGIVGAKRYFDLTEEASDDVAKETWNQMKRDNEIGIKTGHTDNGDYIQLTILNPIDRFTAMYTLSSSLLSPMPEEFIETIGSGSVREGAERYGKFNNENTAPSGHKDNILDYVINLGPYMLETWHKDQDIVFKKNSSWFETNRYFIAGVKLIRVDTSSSTTKIYERFNNGDLDSCGIPSKMLEKEVNKPRVYKTRGDSTFKLNVNSCTQDMWDYLNENLQTWHNTTKWEVKPWMSNDNFLNGLFYSINRKEFASNRGVQPSISYFSDAYLSDPENGISYNDSQAHKDAIASYQVYDSDGESTFGYSLDRAVSYFRAAVKELVADEVISYGSASNPTKIYIDVIWMNQTDPEEYGNAIKKYFEDAFNDPSVSQGRVVLEVRQSAVTSWMDVYYKHMMIGKFDLGFGAISGNTYNPLNFLEVLKSDNSSSFTLNWGVDTSKVTPTKPLVYDNKIWSFDALWAVSDHGGVVNEGENAKIVEKCYMVTNTDEGNNFANGRNFQVVTQFINSSSVQISLTRIQIYVFGYGPFSLSFTPTTNGNTITAAITLDATTAQEIQRQIIKAFKLNDPSKPESEWDKNPFTLVNYNKYWTVEINYSLAVKVEGATEFGAPTESYSSVAKNKNNIKD